MNLKGMIDADINSVFFNASELADYYEVQGIGRILIVQDDDRILEKSDLAAMGTDLGEGLIFVQARDLPKKPLGGDRMSITDKTGKKTDWYVQNIIDNMGIYEIRLCRSTDGY